MASLPPELKGEVASHLATDPESLKACSLALPGYLPFCQSELFSTITLQGKQAKEKVGELKDLLEESPHLAAYVKRFNIIYSPFRWISKDTTLLSILPKLRNLSSFHLHCPSINWKEVTQEVTRDIMDSFLDGPSSPTDIGAFRFPPALPQHPAKEAIYLETLNMCPFYYSDTPKVVGWLLNPENGLSLSRLKKFNLRMESMDQGKLKQISRILDICQGTLEKFTFEPYVKAHHSQSSNHGPLDLSHLVALRSLDVRLQVAMKDTEDFFGNPLPWYIEHIETLPPSNVIENITIHLVIPEHLDLLTVSNFDWSSFQALATVLLKRLPYLRRVDMGIYCPTKNHYDACAGGILRYTTDLQDNVIFGLERLSDDALCLNSS